MKKSIIIKHFQNEVFANSAFYSRYITYNREKKKGRNIFGTTELNFFANHIHSLKKWFSDDERTEYSVFKMTFGMSSVEIHCSYT